MIYSFDRFRVDDSAFRLSVDESPVALEPKALRVMLYLVEHRGRLVRKQELLDQVWGDANVAESTLTRSVGLLRKALEDDSRNPRYIETVPTAGYRFIGVVAVSNPVAAPIEDKPQMWQRAAPEVLPSAGAVRKTAQAVALIACILVLIFSSGWLIDKRMRAASSIRSLAVLPLENLSGDSSQEYFAAGMTDDLTTELARIPSLRVVSRTSVSAANGTRRSLADIAKELKVDAVVEGSVVRAGDRIRITAQLIDVRSDGHLWAQSFEGSASDVLSLQDSVAQQIAAQARLVLGPAPPRAPVNPAAHDAYLRGRYFFNKQNFRHSIESFQHAITLDPTYAPAYAGYASALDAAATFNIGTPEELMPKALAAARQAIRLDPQNGEAYTALGSVQTIYEWNWTAAEQNLTRGISLNPNDSIAEFKYAIYLDAVGRTQDAVTHMRRAVQLDPVSFIANRRLGVTLYLAREFDAALAQLQRTAEMENQPASIDRYLSLIYEQEGDRDEAVQYDLKALHEDNSQLDVVALLNAYQHEGWQTYWRARSRALRTSSPRSCTDYEIGIDDLRVDELDKTFDSFQRALDNHCFYMVLIRADPMFDSVRHDARYVALLKRMHQ